MVDTSCTGPKVSANILRNMCSRPVFWARRASSMSRLAMEISAWARVMLWLRADSWTLVALLLVFMGLL